MNRKVFAAIFSMVLLCSCGNGNVEEQSETAYETTVTTTSLETTSKTVSEETKTVTDVAEADENVPITRDFFNDDVVFEEVMLPVKSISFNTDGTEYSVSFYEYDAAGNECKDKYQNKTDNHGYERITKFGYNPNGTYSRVFIYYNDEYTPTSIAFYDKHGYRIKDDNSEYEYEFDEAERLIRKTSIYNNIKEVHEYTYDEQGRLYKEDCFYMEHNEINFYDYSRRHEYDGNIENIYQFNDSMEEEMLWKIIEKDENGNLIRETVYETIEGNSFVKTFDEYIYDNMNRLICENHRNENAYSINYEYDGDKLKKQTHTSYNIEFDSITEYFYDENDRLIKEIKTYDGGKISMEYSYNDDGSIILRQYDALKVLTHETEYAMIPKIKTDIEYLKYYDIEP